MLRFYYEYVELESTGDEPREFTHIVFDNRRGDQELARCDRHDDAQTIVDALNAFTRPSLGVFG